MKKQELINLLVENAVKSTNLKSSLNAAERRIVEQHGFQKVKIWLEKLEAKKEAEHQKELDARRAKSFQLSVKKYLESMDKAYQILGSFHTGHSMGCYRTILIANKSFQSNNTLQDYAKSSKYKATYGSLSIRLSKIEIQKIQNIEGIWTVLNKDGSANWLEEKGNKSHHSVNWIEGFCYKDSHSRISLIDAKELQAIKQMQIATEVANNSQFIGFQHVRATGACMDGIRAFCNRHGLDINLGYNIGFLKSINDSYSARYLNSVKK